MGQIVKRILYCTTPGYEFEKELDENEEVSDVPIIGDWFSDLIYEALEKYEPTPRGTFCLEDVEDNIYSKAQAYIDKVAPGIDVFIKDITEDGKQLNNERIDITSLLKETLQYRAECEQSYIDAGAYVEKCLMLFQKVACWHFGLQCGKEIIEDVEEWPKPCQNDNEVTWEKEQRLYKPILWFGIEGNDPDPIWTICEDNEGGDTLFWSWHCPVRYLVDEDDYDSFTFWYDMECGRMEPDCENILKKCPLGFIDDEDWDHLDQRINKFFLKQYEMLKTN